MAEANDNSAPPLPDYFWIELVPNYQDQEHLVGAGIMNDVGIVAEVRGAVKVDGKVHSVNMEKARLLAAAPHLRYAAQLALPLLIAEREVIASSSCTEKPDGEGWDLDSCDDPDMREILGKVDVAIKELTVSLAKAAEDL